MSIGIPFHESNRPVGVTDAIDHAQPDDHGTRSLTLRTDLQQSAIQMGRRSYVVVKDPLARVYFYFSQREWAILEMLDGKSSVDQIAVGYSDRFAPEMVSPESLLHFLADAKAKGLLYFAGSSSDTISSTASSPKRTKWWANPLAIRLPGINPDILLDRITTLAQTIAQPLSPSWASSWVSATSLAVLFLVTIAMSVLTVLVHFEQFSTDVTYAASRTTWSWWLVVAAVVSLTKIVHELAHAITCKLFGRECRELGVLFLIGVPCLYCDVSDAWMIPQRWKRMLISAAGILAELMIAAVAVFIWQMSDAGIIRDLCVTVIIVCSVSTLLFNGNPLLRYDGYFVLSDFVATPNLAGRSRQVIRGWLRCLVWGNPSRASATVNTGSDDQPSRSRRAFVFLYGIVSGIYRLAIVFVLGSLAHGWLASSGMTALANLLAVIVGAAIVYRIAQPILKPPNRSRNASPTSKTRQVTLGTFATTLIAACVLTPLPRHVGASGMVTPADATPLYVATSGQLMDAVDYGSTLQAGDAVATLTNPEATLQWQQQETRRTELQSRLESLRRRQVSETNAAAQIPATEDLLKSVTERCELLRSSLNDLVIRSPMTGRLYSPPNVIASTDSKSAARTWTGTPLAATNRGAYLSSRTLLGTVGHPVRREAWLLVDQSDVAAITKGLRVELLLGSQARGTIVGEVIEVASSPIDSVPQEFYAAGLILPPVTGIPALRNEPTYYQVRIRLDSAKFTLPVRSVSPARITLEPASLYQRFFGR